MSEISGETWRVFCAIELPSLVREKISAHIAHLHEAAPDSPASWSRAENVHLTLKFVGEIPAARVNDLSHACANAVAESSPFEIEIGDPGAFPRHGTPRVLWIGVHDAAGKLAALQAKLDDECLRLDFEKEARPFNPHLTIARVHKPQGARALATAHKETRFEPTKIAASELLVIRSELSSAGSKYTVVSRQTLCDKL
ncbi:MAG: RNA 2',3'-cyclic phosphodiesterase [bacterium]